MTRRRSCMPASRWRSCFPRSTADVQQIVRLAAAAGVPIVARGAGTGLSGGAVAIDGALTMVFTLMDSIRRDRPAQPDRDCSAGRDQRRFEPRRGRARAALPTRSGQLRDVHDRRQRGRELGRTALRQVRRDARLGTRPGGRARRRQRHPHRRQDDQGRRRLRPDEPLRRLRGDARPGHRGRRSGCGPGRRPT